MEHYFIKTVFHCTGKNSHIVTAFSFSYLFITGMILSSIFVLCLTIDIDIYIDMYIDNISALLSLILLHLPSYTNNIYRHIINTLTVTDLQCKLLPLISNIGDTIFLKILNDHHQSYLVGNCFPSRFLQVGDNFLKKIF